MYSVRRAASDSYHSSAISCLCPMCFYFIKNSIFYRKKKKLQAVLCSNLMFPISAL